VLFRLVENIGKMAATTVLAIRVGSHEDAGTALGGRALAAKTLNLSLSIDLVVLEHGQLCLLPAATISMAVFRNHG